MHRKTVLATAVAACALTAAIPSGALAAARKPHTPPTAWASTAPKVQATTAATDTALAEVKKQVADLSAAVATLQGQAGGVSAILAAAPQIIDGLTQLQNGLTTLASAYQSVEYGVAQVNVYGGGSIVSTPAWSADVPDDGNGTTVSGTALWPNLSTSAVTKTFTVNAYIRSAENDAAASNGNGPVGQAGGMMTVMTSNPATGATSFQPCAGDATTGGIGGITPVGEPINTPAGPVKTLPFVNIIDGKTRTDQALPGGDAPKLVTCTVSVPAGVVIPGPSIAPTVATIQWSATFLDIPTTTSPGPTD
jgi:hypothetical protein